MNYDKTVSDKFMMIDNKNNSNKFIMENYFLKQNNGGLT